MLGGRGLDGLVNNAGIGTTAPVEFVTEDDLRHHFEVNVFGQVAVTQAFLPLIHRAVGRIVNIGSVGSHVTMPFGGALCASKSALASLTDALRLELRPFGIHVCLVEPGAIATPGVDKTLGDIEAVIRSLPEDGAVRYGDQLRTFARVGHERESHGSPPDVVAAAVRHALTAQPARALSGRQARQDARDAGPDGPGRIPGPAAPASLRVPDGVRRQDGRRGPGSLSVAVRRPGRR